MSEKNKWYDPKPKQPFLPVVNPMRCVSNVTANDCGKLMAAISQYKCYEHFDMLQRLGAVIRLKRNLSVLLNLLMKGKDSLYTADELEYLRELSTRCLPQSLQVTAYALLNTDERYQAQQAMKPMFREARARRK